MELPQHFLKATRNVSKSELNSLDKFFQTVELIFGLRLQIKDFNALLDGETRSETIFQSYLCELLCLCSSQAQLGPVFKAEHSFLLESLQSGQREREHLLHVFFLKIEDGVFLNLLKAYVYAKRVDLPLKPSHRNSSPDHYRVEGLVEGLLHYPDAPLDVVVQRQIQALRQSVLDKRAEKRKLQQLLFTEAGLNTQELDLQKLVQTPELELKLVKAKCSTWKALKSSGKLPLDDWGAYLRSWTHKLLRHVYREALEFQYEKESFGVASSPPSEITGRLQT